MPALLAVSATDGLAPIGAEYGPDPYRGFADGAGARVVVGASFGASAGFTVVVV